MIIGEVSRSESDRKSSLMEDEEYRLAEAERKADELLEKTADMRVFCLNNAWTNRVLKIGGWSANSTVAIFAFCLLYRFNKNWRGFK